MTKNWISSATIYQIFPLTFRNGGETNPESPNQDGWYGNLNGIREKLDYIERLNVDAVWLSPVFESPLKDGFGYNITDYKKIHPMMGNLEEFDALVKESHDRGIKVILDMVFNHTSDQHEWFKESMKSRDPDTNPYADFYVWRDPVYDADGNRQPPNNWRSLDVENPSVWEWNETRQQYYMHTFNRSMPDLDIVNPKVREALLDVARFWLDKGVDGFRLDAVHHMGYDTSMEDDPIFDFNPDAGYHGQTHTHTEAQPITKHFLRQLNELIDSYPARTLPGSPDQPYKPGLLGEVNHEQFAEELIAEGLLDTACTGKLFGKLHDFRDVVENVNRPDLGRELRNYCWAMENHDVFRVLDRNIGDAAKPEHAVLYAAMLAAMPGSIAIFQGGELGLRQGSLEEIVRPDDPAGLNSSFMGEVDAVRAAMPWQDGSNDKMWMGPPEINKPLAPELQEGQTGSTLEQIKQILRLRRDSPALHGPDPMFFPRHEDNEVLLGVRPDPSGREHMLCVFNFASAPKNISLHTDAGIEIEETCAPLSVLFRAFEAASFDGTRVTVSDSPLKQAPRGNTHRFSAYRS